MARNVRPSPADYAPYRADITGCYCPTCTECAYALSSLADGPGSRRLDTAHDALHAELTAGTHKRVDVAEMVTAAKAAKARRLTGAAAAGACPSELATIERGYGKQGSTMVCGTGIGMTPGPDRGKTMAMLTWPRFRRPTSSPMACSTCPVRDGYPACLGAVAR